MAPMKSARIVNAPMHIPPKVAAIGIYFFKILYKLESLCPYKLISYSFNYLATSFGEDPETSIQVLEKTAQVPITKTI